METNTEDSGDTKKAANFETLPFPHFLLKNLKILNLVVWQKVFEFAKASNDVLQKQSWIYLFIFKDVSAIATLTLPLISSKQRPNKC